MWLGLLVAVMLGLMGCTKLRLGYEYADWLVVYSIDDNFDLDKVQRARVKQATADYFKWHRKQMLPAYSEFLTRALVGLDIALPPSRLDSCYRIYKRLLRASLGPILDQGQGLLISLTPEQVETWAEKQRKKNLKLRKDFSGSPEERLELRYQKVIDELENWTGRLDQEQKNKIKVLTGTLPWNGSLWLDTREKFQLRLLAALQAKASGTVIRKILDDYYLHPERFRAKEYQARIKEFEIRLRTIILLVYKMLTPEQKQHFINQVEKLVGDFNKLSNQDKGP